MEGTWLGFFQGKAAWPVPAGSLSLPLLLSLCIAWMDLRTRRIPNYLTFGGAAAGLGFQLGYRGWPGLADSLAGMFLGLALLLWPYLKGGMGAGDVKGFGALGAWLGLTRTFHLFIYTGISGGLIIIAVMWWQGLLWIKVRQLGIYLLNLVLASPRGVDFPVLPVGKGKAIPYGTALAAGMAFLWWRWQDG